MVKIGPLEFTVETYEGAEVGNRRKSMPEPGRCADRIEDFFTVLSGGWNNSWEQHKQVLSLMIECLKSEPGDEPRDKYVQLTQESQFWQDHSARPSKFERLRALEQQQQEEEAQQKQQQQAHSQQHRPQHQQEQRQREQQEQQQSTGQPDQQQQQPQGAQQAYSWLTWWRRRPQTLATAETAAE